MPIALILNEANNQLDNVMDRIKRESIDDTELILQLSIIRSSLKTLEVMTKPTQEILPPGTLIPMKTIPPPTPVPAFVNDVSDDDPDQEDKDIKKAREESRSFFG